MTTNGQSEIFLPGQPAVNSGLYADGGYPAHGPKRPASVAIEGDHLRWSLLTGATHPFNPRGMLDRFTRIKRPGAALRFARDYGVLGLCAHGFPVTQHWTPGYESPEPGVGCDPWAVEGRESLERWYFYSRLAHALLQIAIETAKGHQPPRAHWETVYGDLPSYVDHAMVDPTTHLYAQVNLWATLGNVRPMILAQGPTLHLAGSIFGLLGVQLMTVTTSTAGVATCSACRQPYLREKRIPQRGRANYCSEDCRRIGGKLRKRQQRARQAQKEADNGEA